MTFRKKLNQLHSTTRTSLSGYNFVARQIKIMLDKGQFIPAEKLELQNSCFTAFQKANSAYAELLEIVNREKVNLNAEFPESK